MTAMTWKQKALYERMSDISEECYAAGWMTGNEYTLWEMVANPEASRRYGMSDVRESDLNELREISTEIGGWIRWVDDDDDPDLPSEEWGPVFTPMAEWVPLFNKRLAELDEMRAKYTKDAS